MYRSSMSLSLLSRTGRYTLVVFGVFGFCTSMQIACTFSDDPPKRANPVTDSGPDKTEKDSGASSSSGTIGTTSGDYYGYGSGYGYGYAPNGCYGYGYGYTTYDPYGPYGPYSGTSSSGGCP